MYLDTSIFDINRTKREPYFNMKEAHYHNTYELYYLYSGSRKFFINDTIYHVKKGDLIIILKGDLHRTTYISDLTHERLFIYFSDHYMKNLFDAYGKSEVMKCFQYPHISIPSSRREYIENLLAKLENEFKNKDAFSECLIQSYMNELIIFLIRYQKYRNLSATSSIDSEDAMIQKAARYINTHAHQPITLDHISKYVNLSSPYFSKKFKESTGFGFKEYLLNIRLKKASTLLLETQMPITEIAFKCGFNDSNYFGDVFKKNKGLSPMQYRKNKEFI